MERTNGSFPSTAAISGGRGEGNDRLTSIHDTQQQAIDRARDIAINQQSEMLIQGRDGQIRERNSYGHDPFPPKG